MTAVPITAKANALTLHKPSIDLGGSFSIKLRLKDFCSVQHTTTVDQIESCKGSVKLHFQLPCLDAGHYVLDLIDNSLQQTIATFSAFYK